MLAVSIGELLDQLALAPHLEDAACRHREQLYDAAITRDAGSAAMRAARTQALAICQSCGALDACRQWLNSLPEDQRPIGVVAGTLRTVYRAQPPRSSRSPRPPRRSSRDPQVRADIAALRADGATMQAIAGQLSCSTYLVWRVLQNKAL
jgi:hypothetical protein